MKQFFNAILKPILIFTLYYIIICSTATAIEQIWHIDLLNSIMVLIILTCPIYYYFIKD
jgi:hypothetical protein